MAFLQAMSWHEGENQIHELTGVGHREDNPTSAFLTPRAANMAARYPLMAIGTLDDEDRPWTTIWGTGEPPLAQAVAQSVLGIRGVVDVSFDPVVQAIWKGKDDGEVVRQEEGGGKGRMISALSIMLEERGRVKMYGRIVAGALSKRETSSDDANVATGQDSEKLGSVGDAQLVVHVEQSLGNCPKYLNKKKIVSHTPRPRLISGSIHLTSEALKLISQADLFFISSAHEHEDMDTNHRGGPPGFLRVQQPDDTSAASVLVWPEYSGNNLYQTLGNLMTTPKAGIVIPSFDTGNVLYLTGTTVVLVGAAASAVVSKTKLAVKFTISAARLVEDGLAFRGIPTDDATQGRSPYNPRLRYLSSEKQEEFSTQSGDSAPTMTKLIGKTKITPTITRYRFAIDDPTVFGPWKPGQYAALDFSDELNMGYSHMRDDDPLSLNDDFIRTFTVSSIPNSLGEHGEEFELTVRTVGSITRWMTYQREGMLEVGLRGFGGEFTFDMGSGTGEQSKKIGFIAAGIGITPLLGQMGELDVSKIMVLWSVGIKDTGLALDVLRKHQSLRDQLQLFITGEQKEDDSDSQKKLQQIQDLGTKIDRRRLSQDDLLRVDAEVDDWYLCTAPAMRKQVQEWLPGKSIIFENFDY